MFRNQSVSTHQFSTTPQQHVQRSRFKIEKTHKTTIDSGYLIPLYVDEVLPGDVFNLDMTLFARMATPLYPLMDNLHLESFFFFVPNRLLWTNWKKFMGEQINPGDSIAYTIPQQVSPAGGYAVNSLQDYMGLPTVGQLAGSNTVSHCAFFTRAFNLIWNEFFRDENLQNSVTVDTGDGPDNVANYTLLKRGKRKDYITSALPWPQKGTAVTLPLGTSAPVLGQTANAGPAYISTQAGTSVAYMQTLTPTTGALFADLTNATSATINDLRRSIAVQRILELDARGGTRYIEILQRHFGVTSPDSRLQRPEYLGGGYTPVSINPIAQTAATGTTGSTTPLGQLGAMGTALARNHGFTKSFTEHGVIIGLVSVRADLTYQQGLRKMWSRSTRYDFYDPLFANLGEQAILNKELYCDGSAADNNVFGYQERWGEYRYNPSQVSGYMKSTSSGTLDGWHLAQKFTSLPTLNSTFIQENVPMDRVLAVTGNASGKQFIVDSFFQNVVTRVMPMYSIPMLDARL